MEKPNWRSILDCSWNLHGSINKFFDNVVIPSGYPYFLWNDRIYEVTGKSCKLTEWTVRDIEL